MKREKIKVFTADEYIEKIGVESTHFDWEDGRKARFIYTDEAEESAQVGIEFEDGTFAVVGLNGDHLCNTYEDMVESIFSYLDCFWYSY
jgi:predicted amino acid dehydrogenase